jgi:NAD+ kinase
MLKNVRNYYSLNLPFCGFNFGHVGFLMNNPRVEILEEIIRGEVEFVTSFLLRADVFSDQGRFLDTLFAFNDFYLERAGVLTAKIKIIVNNRTVFSPLVGDGVIVASSAGSTAYNAAAGGAIIPLGTGNLVVTGVCPSIFHRWHTAQVPGNSTIILEATELEDRPVRFLSDGILMPGVVKAVITQSSQAVKLMFAKSQDYEKKVLNLQFGLK